MGHEVGSALEPWADPQAPIGAREGAEHRALLWLHNPRTVRLFCATPVFA